MNIFRIIGGLLVAGFLIFGFFRSQSQDKVIAFNDFTIAKLKVVDQAFEAVSPQVFNWDGSAPFPGESFQKDVDSLKAEQEAVKNEIQNYDAKDHELVDRMRAKTVEYIDSNIRLAGLLGDIGEVYSQEGATVDSLSVDLYNKFQSEAEFNEKLSGEISAAQRELAAEFDFELN